MEKFKFITDKGGVQIGPAMKIPDLIRFLETEIGAVGIEEVTVGPDASIAAPVITFYADSNALELGNKLAFRFGWVNGLKVTRI